MSPEKNLRSTLLHRSIKAWYEGLSIEARKHLSHWDICALKDQAIAATTDSEAKHRNAVNALAARKTEPDEPEPKPRTPRIGKTQRNILRSIKPREVYKTSEIAELVDVSPNTASKSLAALLGAGLIKRVRHGYWKKRRD